MTDDRIAIGRINGPWGVRGHVKVTPLTDNPRRFQPGSLLLLRGQPVRILDVRSPKGYPCLLLEGYADRSAAETLGGAMLEIEEADLPPLEDGEYYIHDLVGLAVETVDGGAVGRLHEVLHTAANDVYVVRREGANDALLPAIPDVIVEVDLSAGRLIVDPLPGLLDA